MVDNEDGIVVDHAVFIGNPPDAPNMDGNLVDFVDPYPLLEERYQRELASLRRQMGQPRNFRERRKLNKAIRKLRRDIFGRLDRVLW